MIQKNRLVEGSDGQLGTKKFNKDRAETGVRGPNPDYIPDAPNHSSDIVSNKIINVMELLGKGRRS
jgi:hypothetical protein